MTSFKVLVVLSLVMSLVHGLPIKDDEIDDLIYRLQELRNQNHYEGYPRNPSMKDQYYTRSLDSIGGGYLVRNAPQRQNDENPNVEDENASSSHPHQIMYASQLRAPQQPHAQSVRHPDPLGGGHLVRNLDSLGGGNLVRNLDAIGGGYLVRGTSDSRAWQSMDSPPKRNLDALGGANLLKRNLDSIGGANLLKRSLDSLGGANLLKRSLDSLGGANLLKRSLDSLGGANLLKRK